jgi:hypothetical protein
MFVGPYGKAMNAGRARIGKSICTLPDVSWNRFGQRQLEPPCARRAYHKFKKLSSVVKEVAAIGGEGEFVAELLRSYSNVITAQQPWMGSVLVTYYCAHSLLAFRTPREL